jgi:hypothetical protein
MSALGLGCVKTRSQNLSGEYPSPSWQPVALSHRKIPATRGLEMPDREHYSPSSWRARVFTQPGSIRDLHSIWRRLPVWPRQRNFVGASDDEFRHADEPPQNGQFCIMSESFRRGFVGAIKFRDTDETAQTSPTRRDGIPPGGYCTDIIRMS